MTSHFWVRIWILTSLLVTTLAVPFAHLFGNTITQSCVLPSLHAHILVGSANSAALINHLNEAHGCFNGFDAETAAEAAIITSSEEGLIISVTEESTLVGQLTSTLTLPILLLAAVLIPMIGLTLRLPPIGLQSPIRLALTPTTPPPISA